MSSRPSVLVVGAGAVGQVFGHHLHRAGAKLTFFVREKHRAAAEQGFLLYHLRLFRPPRAVRLEGFAVATESAEVAQRSFDQVFLTVPSQAIRGGWLSSLVAAAPNATWVSIQPGPEDREALRNEGIRADQLISGMMSLVSYPAPLPGETRMERPGIAFWHPPAAKTAFSGPEARLHEVLLLLGRGGFPVRRHPDVHREVSFFTAVLLPYLAALEGAGWSLRKLSEGSGLQLGAAAAREAANIVASTHGRKTMPARLAPHAGLIRAALWLAPKVAPFPVERYLERHFTKTHEQTWFILDALRRAAQQKGISAPALQRLTSTLPDASSRP